MTDPLRQLSEDHGHMRRLTEAFSVQPDDASRRELATRIGEALRVHTACAGEVFYPTVARSAGADVRGLVERSAREHAVQAALLTRALSSLSDPADTVDRRPSAGESADRTRAAEEAVASLRDHLGRHAHTEEARLFPAVRGDLGDALERIGERLARRRAATAAPLTVARPG